MPKNAETPLSPEQLGLARTNYLRCLNLPKNSQVLFVTDKTPINGKPDTNLLLRNTFVGMLEEQTRKDGHRVATICFDSDMQEEYLHDETARALNEIDDLEQNENTDHTTTVVYLGEKWLKRENMYRAISEFTNKRTVRVAGSLGFTTGDCRVMSELDVTKANEIEAQCKYFENFFAERPQGSFEITTTDKSGETHILSMDYDTTKAPFETELGKFDEEHKVMLRNYQYINIPGGEHFAAPYPLSKISGQFYAEDLLFTVQDGIVINAELKAGKTLEDLNLTQREAVRIIQTHDKQHQIPVAELGLGFFELADIKTYTDCSTVSLEKTGPHIGLGHNVSPNKEKEKIDEIAGDFNHTDFVLDKAVLLWKDPQGTNPQQFYPPRA